jgi:hypothetical protein
MKNVNTSAGEVSEKPYAFFTGTMEGRNAYRPVETVE